MLCQVCHKNEATVHYTEVSGSKVIEIHLCEKCAIEKGVSIKPQFLLGGLMSGLVEFEKSTKIVKGKKCPGCGLTYDDFKRMGRLGCSKCYETFKQSLTALLETIHGSSVHAGKVPAIVDRKVDKGLILKKLRERLRKLVEKEEFEEAARLRDEIRKLDK